MKTKTIIALCALSVLVSCTGKSKDNQISKSNDSISVEKETIEGVNDNTVKVRKVALSDSLVQGKFSMIADFSIDYPESGNDYLLQNIREWMNETMGGKYEGKVNAPEDMLKYYVKQYITPEQAKLEWNTNQDVKIKKTYETEKFVTFTYSIYSYLGGAHGMTYTGGNTFRKSDGRKLGWDMFCNDFDYNQLFKEALKKQYFNVKTEEELENCLMLSTPGYLPKPASDPYFSSNGVSFIYQQYEIACYAAGAPEFTIPYNKLNKYFTSTAKNLLK